MADERPRGVHLTDKQLVFVFMSATVVAVVVFLCGVLVGRGVQTARGPLNDAGTIGAPQVVSDGASAEPPVADGMARQGASSPAPGAGEFTYAERLGKTPPPERLKVDAAAQEAAPRRAVPPPNVPAEPVATPAASTSPGDYTVQITAVKSREEADAVVRHLKAKGYDAFVVVPEAGDRLGVFRVRVGSFKDKRQADILAQRLLSEEKRYKPWVTR